MELDDPRTWPPGSIVVRCGAAGTDGLSDRLGRHGEWSVYSAPGVAFEELCRSCPNTRVRRTTVGAALLAGGSLRPSDGPPYHCDLGGLTPEGFDAILESPEANPALQEGRFR